jgi:uncharacterized protein YciI
LVGHMRRPGGTSLQCKVKKALMTQPQPPTVRFVVFHKPGPQWQMDVDFREQIGVQDHVMHYLQFHEQGKLELGGPFLMPDSGGMMVAVPEVSREELEAFAAADPAVQAGLLTYEVRPWYNPMGRRK